jgi:hypothetical protein
MQALGSQLRDKMKATVELVFLGCSLQLYSYSNFIPESMLHIGKRYLSLNRLPRSLAQDVQAAIPTPRVDAP